MTEEPCTPADQVREGIGYVKQRYGYDGGGHAEPAPPQSVAEQVRDLERIIERVREAVGTDQRVSAHTITSELEAQHRALRAEFCDVFGLDNDPSIDILDAARALLDEARNWARHGYEIGQRHCGWTDHGVAPSWLTEGWPPHFDSCKHAARAAEYDTALSRLRSLPEQPEIMDAKHAQPDGYLHGYKVAIREAKRAARVDPADGQERAWDRELDRRHALMEDVRLRDREDQ